MYESLAQFALIRCWVPVDIASNQWGPVDSRRGLQTIASTIFNDIMTSVSMRAYQCHYNSHQCITLFSYIEFHSCEPIPIVAASRLVYMLTTTSAGFDRSLVASCCYSGMQSFIHCSLHFSFFHRHHYHLWDFVHPICFGN